MSYFEGIDISTVNIGNGVGYLANGLDFVIDTIDTIDNHPFVQSTTVFISFALVSLAVEYTLVSFEIEIGYPSCTEGDMYCDAWHSMYAIATDPLYSGF